MTKLIAILFIFLLIQACHTSTVADTTADTNSAEQIEVNTSEDTAEKTADSVAVPAFTLEFDLDKKVEELLQNGKEDLIILVMIDGEPKDMAAVDGKDYFSTEDRVIYLMNQEFTLLQNSTTWTMNGKVSKEALEALEDKDYRVTINIFSGRKSSENNLLDTEALIENISILKGKTSTIKVTLL